MLVECHRHDELRDSRGKCLRRSADSAVVNDGCRAGEQAAERNRIDHVDARWQVAAGAGLETVRRGRRERPMMRQASIAAAKNAEACLIAEPGVNTMGGGPRVEELGFLLVHQAA